MKKITLFLLLFPLTAMAQIDTHPDGIGIYFDTEATTVVTTAETGDYVQAYLIGTNMSQSGNLYVWESSVWTSYEGYNAPYIIGTLPNGYNTAMNMPGSPGYSFVALVYGGEPFPAGQITLLANLSIFIEDASVPVGLFVSSSSNYSLSGYGPEYPLYPASGSSTLPVAVINGEAPVATKSLTMDSMKALFR